MPADRLGIDFKPSRRGRPQVPKRGQCKQEDNHQDPRGRTEHQPRNHADRPSAQNRDEGRPTAPFALKDVRRHAPSRSELRVPPT